MGGALISGLSWQVVNILELLNFDYFETLKNRRKKQLTIGVTIFSNFLIYC